MSSPHTLSTTTLLNSNDAYWKLELHLFTELIAIASNASTFSISHTLYSEKE